MIFSGGEGNCWIDDAADLGVCQFLSWAFHGSSPYSVNQESVIFYNSILSGQIPEQAMLSSTLGSLFLSKVLI